MTIQRSRWLEDLGFAAAIFQGLVYGMGEAARSVGLCPGPCPVHVSFPWGLAASMGICALPKYLGRGTAGKVWQTIAGKIPGGGA